jgi:ubiquitin carboxyl-terminal hydrolase 5/13
MLTDMGFSRNAAMRALSATQNNVEAACGWIYEHIDDKDLNDPLPKKSAKAAQGPPEHLIAQVTDMGFTAHQAKAVLKKYVNTND